jgi:hypothetical protein
MKRCRVCDDELVSGDNWTKSFEATKNYKCGPCNSEYHKQRRLDNPGQNAIDCSRWYSNNKDVAAAISKSWRTRNHAYILHTNSIRRAKVRGQTPEMNTAELVEIEAMYLYNQIMPRTWHVDHIDPIDNGGLHHPSNLQILSKHDNLSKGAKI